MKPGQIISAFIFLFAVALFSQAKAARLSIIPAPALCELRDGQFNLTIGTPIVAREASLQSAGEFLAGLLSRNSGTPVPLNELPGGRRYRNSRVVLELDSSLADLGAEGYVLDIGPQRVRIASTGAAGVFYGCQTVRQLLPATIEGEKIRHAQWFLPCLRIEDSPRFGWRGLMIDCSRTFQPLPYLRKQIDLLALYKLNVLHLHLTDDQGWRLEIERYPELTGSRGAFFPERYGKDGGYYSQAQISELVAYAAERNVTVVPEIEMPGHCLAALAAYPELSCTGGPFEIHPFFKGPGIQRDVYCAGSKKTFEFLENVLAEVIALFPSKFIHVGGDEVPKDRWKSCPRCRQRIRDEGLKDENELQSYFIRRIAKFLEQRGKRLIGWDEILEGGLAPGATVMSWRGIRGGVAAARMGHDVVMSPTSHCYLDYTHERIPVELAYSYEPVPEELPPDKRAHVLGVQGNIWTHIAVNPAATDIQVWPRLAALAEVGWSLPEHRDWENFQARLHAHFSRLAELGVEYYGRH